MAQQTISKMERVQTAVEWLQERYNQGNDYERHLTESEFEQAKQMEKEQMHKCGSFWRGKDNEIEKPIFEQYYNETYK